MKRDKTIDSFESMYNKSTSSEPLNAHSIEDFALNEKMAHFIKEILQALDGIRREMAKFWKIVYAATVNKEHGLSSTHYVVSAFRLSHE